MQADYLTSEIVVHSQSMGTNRIMQRECWTVWSLYNAKNKITPNTKLTTWTSEIVLHSQSMVSEREVSVWTQLQKWVTPNTETSSLLLTSEIALLCLHNLWSPIVSHKDNIDLLGPCITPKIKHQSWLPWNQRLSFIHGCWLEHAEKHLHTCSWFFKRARHFKS